jgi:oligoribonuclease NrnB/cAMP/cGMP phosphodiesterase (DHH superfamily)
MQKFDSFIVSHWDADGIICASLLYQKFKDKNFYTLFTSPFLLKPALTKIIMKNEELNELFVCDFGGSKVTLSLASCFQKCFWIDHHIWEEKTFPENVEVIIKEEKSCARVVSKFFSIRSELVDIADEIDTNDVKSSLARNLRLYISAVKWRYGKFPAVINANFRKLATVSSIEELKEFLNLNQVKNLINEFVREVEKIESQLFDFITIREIDNIKVCFCEPRGFIPAYRITNFIQNNLEIPFDIVAIINRRNKRTKLELRTLTNFNVYKLAESLGGGGHRRAASVTIERKLTLDEIVELIAQVY